MLLKQNPGWKPRSPEPILGKDILGEHTLVPSCYPCSMHVNQVSCLCAKEARSPIVLYSQLKLDSLKLSTNFSMTWRSQVHWDTFALLLKLEAAKSTHVATENRTSDIEPAHVIFHEDTPMNHANIHIDMHMFHRIITTIMYAYARAVICIFCMMYGNMSYKNVCCRYLYV